MNLWNILCWGPIEALSNGYFVREYSLLELLSRSKTNKLILLIEYTEDIKTYKVSKLGNLNTIKISVPGNFTKSRLKYFKFFIYQIINTLRFFYIFKKSKAIIVGGVGFLPSTLIIKLLSPKSVIIADPQMMLTEREMRTYKRLPLLLLLKFVEGLFLKTSNFTIAISSEMKSYIVNNFNYPVTRIFVIPHKLPKKFGFITCRNKKEFDVIKLAFVGDLLATHNLISARYLINALSILKMFIKKNVELLLIGRNNENIVQNLRSYAISRSVIENVKILGFVEDLDEVLCDADILLAPVFTMSGVSTKMLYYLRFKDKIILASREALEGIERLSNNVVVADGPVDFINKFLMILNKNYGENLNN